MILVRCGCSHAFEVEDALAGGLSNCPRCGKAASVPGLRDPFWRALQGVALLAWGVGVALAWQYGGGWLPALLVAVVVGGLVWLLSRAF